MKQRILGLLVLSLALVVSVSADDAKPKKKDGQGKGKQRANAQLMKPFAAIELTDEQKAKVKVLVQKANEETKALREEAGLTPELTKKRGEAMKAARQAGLKGKELAAEVDKNSGMNEAQLAAVKKMGMMRTKLQKAVVELLTDEQKAQLPARLTGSEKKKEKGKKKKAE